MRAAIPPCGAAAARRERGAAPGDGPHPSDWRRVRAARWRRGSGAVRPRAPAARDGSAGRCARAAAGSGGGGGCARGGGE
eukprot:679285-Prymnesium_polylepis.1